MYPLQCLSISYSSCNWTEVRYQHPCQIEWKESPLGSHFQKHGTLPSCWRMNSRISQQKRKFKHCFASRVPHAHNAKWTSISPHAAIRKVETRRHEELETLKSMVSATQFVVHYIVQSSHILVMPTSENLKLESTGTGRKQKAQIAMKDPDAFYPTLLDTPTNNQTVIYKTETS